MQQKQKLPVLCLGFSLDAFLEGKKLSGTTNILMLTSLYVIKTVATSVYMHDLILMWMIMC